MFLLYTQNVKGWGYRTFLSVIIPFDLDGLSGGLDTFSFTTKDVLLDKINLCRMTQMNITTI